MIREEQIDKFAQSKMDCEFWNESLYEGIKIGAKWADENPKEGMVSIDKACEYLENKLKGGLGYYEHITFVNQFRLAMEE